MHIEIQRFYDRAFNVLILYGPRILLGILLFIIGWWFIKLVSKWAHSGMHKRDFDPSLKPFFLSFLVIALRILLILAVMQIIGIEMTLFASIIAAFSVAAGLALSGTLQNFASGVLILILKPFRVGDNVIAQGQEGIVSSIQIFYTLVTTRDNKTVIFPNSKLSNEVIVNLSLQGIRRLDIELKLSYALDLEQIKDIINRAVDKSTTLLKSPERRIGIAELEADGFKLLVNVWTNAHDFQQTKLFVQEQILTDLKASGIKLPGM